MKNNYIDLAICGRHETKAHLEGNFTHTLSILDPEKSWGGVSLPRRTRHTKLLQFHNLEPEEMAWSKPKLLKLPTKKDMESIIEVFQHASHINGGVLVHCELGKSRCTAAAMVGLVSLGLQPQTAFDIVCDMRKAATPNRQMLQIGGKLIGDKGALDKLAKQHKAKNPLSQKKTGISKSMKRLKDSADFVMNIVM